MGISRARTGDEVIKDTLFMPKPLPKLIVASSETSADLLYATQFHVSDPIVFLEQNGRRVIILSDLEIDRGRRDAKVEEIVSLSELNKKLRPKGPEPVFKETVVGFLKARRVKRAEVPSDFPLGLAQCLAEQGVELVAKDGLFFEEREFKKAAEVKKMQRAIAITEAGMARGIEVLKASEPGKGNVLQWNGAKLTSELLRAEIDSAILRAGGHPANTIVAGGNQACDPHERGSGPLKANSLIILDIFPRDAASGFFGDLTRTVIRGKANSAQRKLWNTVLEGQKFVLDRMKPGVDGGSLQDELKAWFRDHGYPTEVKNGRWSGFFHGTGHGLGLEIHEVPRFTKTVFKPGQVITVEPGLYYYGLGGVRIEDDVLVTETGIKVLSSFPKELEI